MLYVLNKNKAKAYVGPPCAVLLTLSPFTMQDWV